MALQTGEVGIVLFKQTDGLRRINNIAETKSVFFNGTQKKVVIRGSDNPFCLLVIVRGRSPNSYAYAFYSGYVPSLSALTRTNLSKISDADNNITNNGDSITITSSNSQSEVSITKLLGNYTYTLENLA